MIFFTHFKIAECNWHYSNSKVLTRKYIKFYHRDPSRSKTTEHAF